MHVCADDRPFINRIDLKFILLDYQGNLWYVEYVKIDRWWYIFICCFRLPSKEKEYLQRFFTTVCRQVLTQITSLRDCIVAKIAFFALFANVSFQITFQITKSGRCKVTLVRVV